MTCVSILFFSCCQYIDSVARAPSAPILSDNGILATGLPYGHGGGRCSQIKEAPDGWCIAAAMVRRWKWGATEPGSQDKQRTCHAKFALTLGLRNQTTSNNKVLLSSYLSNSLSLLPFLARSLAFCSLSLSLYLPLSFSRCPFPSSRPSSSQQR